MSQFDRARFQFDSDDFCIVYVGSSRERRKGKAEIGFNFGPRSSL